MLPERQTCGAHPFDCRLLHAESANGYEPILPPSAQRLLTAFCRVVTMRLRENLAMAVGKP